MSLILSTPIQRDNSAAYKYIRKSLQYFAAGGNDPGERHELNVLHESLRSGLRIGGQKFTPTDGTYFSVDSWPGIGTLGHQDKAMLTRQFEADAPKKVMGGNHEIDIVLEPVTPTAVPSRWLLECKSGSAGSNQTQMTSYVETVMHMISAPVPCKHYFGHCRDSATPPTKTQFEQEAHRFLSTVIQLAFGGAITHIVGTHPDRFMAVKAYLQNLGYSTAPNANPTDELSKILAYESTAPLSHPLPVAGAGGVGPLTVHGAGAPAPLLSKFPSENWEEAVNEVLLGRFGFGIGLVNVGAVKDDRLKAHYAELECRQPERTREAVRRISTRFVA